MPEWPSDFDEVLDSETRIVMASRLDSALDDPAPSYAVLASFVSLAAEIRDALRVPVLSGEDRARIHARAVGLARGSRRAGLRRAWPELTRLRSRPALVGGAAAAVIVVGGLAALRERRAQPSFGSA
jgi:hypothetical protein